MRPLKLTPQVTPEVTAQVNAQEPLRTLQWIREHVLAGLTEEEVSDLWLQQNLPHVRINRTTRLYYESKVRAWVTQREG